MMALLRAALTALALLTLAGAASAQTAPEPAAQADAPPTSPAPSPELSALLEVLRDDAARARLIDELERLSAAAVGAEPPADDDEADAASDAPITVGRQLALVTQSAADAAQDAAEDFYDGLRATERQLRALTGARSGALLDAGADLVWVIGATVGASLVLGLLARRLVRRIAAASATASLAGRGWAWLTMLAISVLAVLLAWAAGNAMATFAPNLSPANALNQTLFLNAFLIVQLGKVALRALLAPDAAPLRLAPMTDRGARYWSQRLGGLASVLGYGLLLVTPIVSQTVSFFTGRGVQVLVYSVVLLWSIALVIRHRRAPADWLRGRAQNGGDTAFRLMVAALRVWHWPALLFLFSLFVAAVARSGAVEPILFATVKALGVLLAGGVLGALMSRGVARGVRLPGEVKAHLPLLEDRLTAFVRRFLGVARIVLLLGTLGAAVTVSGVYDMGAWFARRFGDDFAGLMVSVSVIVVFAFLLWLALASWVDYRLNPDRSEPATAREQTLLTLMRNAATIMILIITTMFTLSEIGLDIAPLLASAGVLGLAIGFGAQRLVQDIITGVFIQFENAINVGDVVTVGGVTGAVEKLTIRSVSLRSLDGTYHIIPFSSVEMVSNFMRGFAFHVADVGIAYRENVAEAKALMFKAFDDLREDPAFKPNILGGLDWHGVTSLGDSAVNLRARIRTRPGAQWAVGRAYNEAVKRRFDEAGVEIPFPHMTLWFGEDKQGGAPPLRVAPGPGMGAALGARPEADRPRAPLSPPTRGQDAPNEPDDGR